MKHESLPAMPPKNKIDPSKLEWDINQALRNAGLVDISAEISDNLEVVLMGSVEDRFQKEKAFEIARTFKDVRKVRDRIYMSLINFKGLFFYTKRDAHCSV